MCITAWKYICILLMSKSSVLVIDTIDTDAKNTWYGIEEKIHLLHNLPSVVSNL